MDVAAPVVMNQAMLQQTLAVASIKQAADAGQAAAAMLETAAQPPSETSSIPLGSNGRIIDILA